MRETLDKIWLQNTFQKSQFSTRIKENNSNKIDFVQFCKDFHKVLSIKAVLCF